MGMRGVRKSRSLIAKNSRRFSFFRKAQKNDDTKDLTSCEVLDVLGDEIPEKQIEVLQNAEDDEDDDRKRSFGSLPWRKVNSLFTKKATSSSLHDDDRCTLVRFYSDLSSEGSIEEQVELFLNPFMIADYDDHEPQDTDFSIEEDRAGEEDDDSEGIESTIKTQILYGAEQTTLFVSSETTDEIEVPVEDTEGFESTIKTEILCDLQEKTPFISAENANQATAPAEDVPSAQEESVSSNVKKESIASSDPIVLDRMQSNSLNENFQDATSPVFKISDKVLVVEQEITWQKVPSLVSEVRGKTNAPALKSNEVVESPSELPDGDIPHEISVSSSDEVSQVPEVAEQEKITWQQILQKMMWKTILPVHHASKSSDSKDKSTVTPDLTTGVPKPTNWLDLGMITGSSLLEKSSCYDYSCFDYYDDYNDGAFRALNTDMAWLENFTCNMEALSELVCWDDTSEASSNSSVSSCEARDPDDDKIVNSLEKSHPLPVLAGL